MNRNTDLLVMKTCTKCKEEKPSTLEYFHQFKRSSDGLRGMCKICRNEENRRYKQENKKRILEYNKEYRKNSVEVIKRYREKNKERTREYNKRKYEENREDIIKQTRKYYEENKERLSERSKEYREENKERISKRAQKYREENKEYYKKYFKRYYEEKPHIFRSARQRRRTKGKEVSHTLSAEQWEEIKMFFGGSCSYCGMTEEEHVNVFNEVLHQEHFIPLSKGGEYTHNNIIVACRACNCSKKNKDFFEWYPSYEYYSKRREKIILEYLSYKDNIQQLSIL